ncbi:MAG: dipeptide epimerase, partial [Kangiellaceae bacterium]|nr:dipeptide epimerase [Kangiellaceae bacterium]
MKITDIKFAMLKVPLRTPFKTALRTVNEIEDVIVIVETDSGNTGYGEAPATAAITGDTHGSIIEAIRVVIKPALIGKSIANLNEITNIIQTSIVKNYSAKAAIEIAIYDLFAQLYNAPLYKILGGGEPTLATDITISVDYIDKMVEDSKKAVALGFETLKIKVGKDMGLDIERVKAIYAATKDSALLRLDANQGWTAKEAVFAIRNLEDSGVKLELVEQPVRAEDLDGMKYITERVHSPIMADESVFTLGDAWHLTKQNAADIYSVYPGKNGGILATIEIAHVVKAAGLVCSMGSNLELGIATAAMLHVGACVSVIDSETYPGDYLGPLYHQADLLKTPLTL